MLPVHFGEVYQLKGLDCGSYGRRRDSFDALKRVLTSWFKEMGYTRPGIITRAPLFQDPTQEAGTPLAHVSSVPFFEQNHYLLVDGVRKDATAYFDGDSFEKGKISTAVNRLVSPIRDGEIQIHEGYIEINRYDCIEDEQAEQTAR